MSPAGKVLVTGASGFIGTRLVNALLENAYDVHIVTRSNKQPWGARVKYHRTDLARGPLPSLVDFAAIVHLASVIDINASLAKPRERIDQNTVMDLVVLEALRINDAKPLVIFASTDRVYGRTKKRVVGEEEKPFPIEPYTASKIMGETMLELYAHLFDFPYIVLRFDSVYGPGQPRTMFISDMIQKMLVSDSISTGPLSTKKNFVYVDDAVDALQKALTAPRKAYNQVYNIGGKHGSLKSVLATLQKAFKARKRTITVREEARSMRPSKAEVNPFALSTQKARRLLGWKASTTLYKGLQNTIEYFDV